MTTKIEWCDETLGIISGCSKISEGCAHCYAERMSKRLAGRYGYPKDDPFRPTYHSDKIHKIYRWKKPRRIFYGSMGDIFHAEFRKGIAPWEKVYNLFWHCQQNQRHTHIFLTKRPQNMLEFFEFWYDEYEALPLKNVWLGITAENQKRADERIPELLKCRKYAEVLFVSAEPLLEETNIEPWLVGWTGKGSGLPKPLSTALESLKDIEKINWVIAGKENGPGARQCPEEAIKNLYSQCKSTNIPFFDKSLNYIAREFPR